MRRLGILLLPLIAVIAYGQNFQPPTDMAFPPPQSPLPRALWLGYVDAGVLLVALVLAVLLVLRWRSRWGVGLLSVASLLYFGFYRHGCICPVGATQNVTLALGPVGYALPLVVGIFFVLPLLFALFYGRVFCSAVCPLGAAQEVVLLHPLKLPAWLEEALGLLPYAYLGAGVLFAATGSAFLICQYDPFVLFFRQSGSQTMLIAGVALLLISTVVGRPYCRFLCPYGVLLRLLAPLARHRVSITPGTCISCRLCEDACPYGAIRVPTPEGGPGRREGKGRLVALLVLLPVLIAGGVLLGRQAGPVFARLDPTVQIAEEVSLKEHRLLESSWMTTGYDQTGKPTAELYRAAGVIRGRITRAAGLFGGWLGLVIGLKLLALAVRRRRVDYQADPAACFSCARCYKFCPVKEASHDHA